MKAWLKDYRLMLRVLLRDGSRRHVMGRFKLPQSVIMGLCCLPLMVMICTSVASVAPLAVRYSLVVEGVVVPVDLEDLAEGGPGVGPACVEGHMGLGLDELTARQTVALRQLQVVTERSVDQALRDEHCDRQQGAQLGWQPVLPGPDLPEKDVIVEMCELTGDAAEHIYVLHSVSFFLLREALAEEPAHRGIIECEGVSACVLVTVARLCEEALGTDVKRDEPVGLLLVQPLAGVDVPEPGSPPPQRR